MTREIIEQKLKNYKTNQEEIIKEAQKLEQQLNLLKKNYDGYEGAIFSLNDLLKDLDDKEVKVTETEVKQE
jgi:seryl-tRNA synthetase